MLLRLIKRKLSFIFLLYVLILFAFNACENPIMMKLLEPLVQEKRIENIKKAKIEMILIPGGSFEMGNNNSLNDEKPEHTVTLSSFYMGKYEVTRELYEAVMESSPHYDNSNKASGEVQGKLPVDAVNWYDAIVFCNKLSMAEKLSPAYSVSNSTNPAKWGAIPTGDRESWNVVVVAGSNGYRLPTEAQWEYAAKGGDGSLGNSSGGNDGSWNSGNSDNKIHEVGKKKPNVLGLCDMSDNVWEWCWDWHGNYSSDSQTNPTGPKSGAFRIVRGKGLTYRYDHNPVRRNNDFGFRIVRPADSSTTKPTFTVTFDANSGSGTVSAQTATAGSDITLPEGSGLSRTGFTFGGWNTNAEGTGTNFNAGASYIVNGNVTLYAKWMANEEPDVLDLERAEQVSLSNGWYAVYRFDLPSGKTWGDYEGLSADYMFKAEDLATATSRNGRLMGPYQPLDFTLSDGNEDGPAKGKKMAIANYNSNKNIPYILDYGKLSNNNIPGSLVTELATKSIIAVGDVWFTYSYDITRESKFSSYDDANYPADTDPGPFYFALGLPSAIDDTPNNYYIRDVTLIDKNNGDKVTAVPAYFNAENYNWPAFTGYDTPDGNNGYAKAARSMVDGSQPQAVPK